MRAVCHTVRPPSHLPWTTTRTAGKNLWIERRTCVADLASQQTLLVKSVVAAHALRGTVLAGDVRAAVHNVKATQRPNDYSINSYVHHIVKIFYMLDSGTKRRASTSRV